LTGWQIDANKEEIRDVEDQMAHTPEDDELLLCKEEEEDIREWYEEEKHEIEEKYVPRGTLQVAWDSRTSEFKECKRAQ
jgi:hypothetical protein